MRWLKYGLVVSGALAWLGLATWWLGGDDLVRELDERRAEVTGGLADRYIASQTASPPAGAVKTVAGLHHLPVAVSEALPGVWRAGGVGNSFLIQTDEGNVLFDAGLATQAARQKRLLQEAVPGELKYIILSHSHADHIGAARFWLREFPEARVITHRRFLDGQRYLDDLETYFWNRNRLLYTFMPETPPAPDSQFAYGAITPDILVPDGEPYRFNLGGVAFVVLPAPGAEGDDNLVLWLPDRKALFSGDVFGPLFPMVPNLFTLRGEKFRDPVAYIETLGALEALQPQIVLPSHFEPERGREHVVSSIRAMRDATQYLHDATVAGMNAGKSVWQLMREIRLPPELALSQGHGKVSWNVRSIWEHYSTWFHFESTTELYPLPVRELYPQLAELAGAGDLLRVAREALESDAPVAALHYVEIALAGTAGDREALALRLAALERLRERAQRETGNFSELGWLDSRIAATRVAMGDA